MKEVYISPVCELIILGDDDIITASGEIEATQTETALPELEGWW